MNYYLKELQDWISAHDKEQLHIKCRRVYRKCIRNGKMALAQRIKDKYLQYIPKTDMEISFAYALKAAQIATAGHIKYEDKPDNKITHNE